MSLDLAKITPTHLSQEFREQFKAKDAVAQKQVTFFIQAVKDAEIELSNRVLNKTRTRAARRTLTQPRKKAEGEQKTSNGTPTDKRDSINGQKTEEKFTGMTCVPIPLGLDKVAYLQLPANWENKDLNRLVRIIKLSLGDESDITDEKAG